MITRRAGVVAAVALTTVAVGWVLFVGLPRWYGRPGSTSAASAPSEPAAEDVRKIKVRLFYVGVDGTRLVSVEREVPFAEQLVAQARHIIEAQLAPVQSPLVSAIPPGSALRAIFLAPDGSAYVDVSADITTAHPGGSLNELLTIYTIVQSLTANLPAITAVQLLVDGKEVDTLAGHVDIKRPLPRADAWVNDEPAALAAPASEAAAQAPAVGVPAATAAATGTPSR